MSRSKIYNIWAFRNLSLFFVKNMHNALNAYSHTAYYNWKEHENGHNHWDNREDTTQSHSDEIDLDSVRNMGHLLEDISWLIESEDTYNRGDVDWDTSNDSEDVYNSEYATWLIKNHITAGWVWFF